MTSMNLREQSNRTAPADSFFHETYEVGEKEIVRHASIDLRSVFMGAQSCHPADLRNGRRIILSPNNKSFSLDLAFTMRV